jgi:predicted TIM-barrel fold metal-dependent hydrolase
VAETGRVSWIRSGDEGRRRIGYHGRVHNRRLRFRYGFDGWQEPIHEVPMENVEAGLAVVEVDDLDNHFALDCAIALDREWDNNGGLDYRLWLGFDALDAHLHVSGGGAGAMGIASLGIAMASAGIVAGVSSWIDNRALDRLDLATARLFPLVWIRPGETSTKEVNDRLSKGAVGLKLHPTVDDYRADDPSLDRYIDIAERVGCPVACHSAPGDADPDNIRRLAERHPDVPIILYHTYLGPYEGRRRALEHAKEQKNLYLESSWCRWEVVRQLIDGVGPDRVLFGSDASIDGPRHYHRDPPNVEGSETYNDGLISLVSSLDPETARKVMGDNARRLFQLNGSSHA